MTSIGLPLFLSLQQPKTFANDIVGRRELASGDFALYEIF
jgi:hypothetical protein